METSGAPSFFTPTLSPARSRFCPCVPVLTIAAHSLPTHPATLANFCRPKRQILSGAGNADGGHLPDSGIGTINQALTGSLP